METLPIKEIDATSVFQISDVFRGIGVIDITLGDISERYISPGWSS